MDEEQRDASFQERSFLATERVISKQNDIKYLRVGDNRSYKQQL